MRILTTFSSGSLGSGRRCFTIYPSSLTFDWEECPCCFWLSYNVDLEQPRKPMAKIYKQCEVAVLRYLKGRDLASVAAGAPHARLEYPETKVRSKLITFPGHPDCLVISGRFDCLFRRLSKSQCGGFVDGPGHILPDIKMAQVKDEFLAKYTRQDHSYLYCLENAAPGFPAIDDIDELGLIVYEADAFTNVVSGRGSLVGTVAFVKLEIDRPAFMIFLEEVLTLLEGPMPPAAPDCKFCQYRGWQP